MVNYGVMMTMVLVTNKRAQSSSYNKYIDGIGFVLGGKRQERYCPNCHQFWDERIEVSGVPQSSTRIPLIPDQTTFIKQWYDWYRGYAITTDQDGSEERQALIGEALSEVSLGHLPRTTEELQARDTELINRQAAISQQDSTITALSRFPLTTRSDIDPEDRIFDSSSNPESPEASDNSDNEDSPRSAQQELLSNLEQNIEDIRANVIQLTRRIPQYRDSSQVSTISRQLSSVTRNLAAVRRHRHPHPQQHPIRQAMEDHRSTGGNHYGERHLLGFDSSAHSLTTQEIRHLNDEELQQRIGQIQNRISRTSEINSVRGGPLRPLDHESYFTRVRLLEQAMQEQAHRRFMASAFGNREGVERHRLNFSSPPTSLLARSAPGQGPDQSLAGFDRNFTQLQTPENEGTSNASTGLPGSVNRSTETDAPDPSPGDEEARSRTFRQTYGRPDHPSGPSRSESSRMEGLDGSDPSLSRTEAGSAGQSSFSSLSMRLRYYRERYDLEHATLSGQSARTSPDFPSDDRSEPRIWRHGASGAMPEIRHRSNILPFLVPRSGHAAAEPDSTGSTSERRNMHTATADFSYGSSSPSFNLGFDGPRTSDTPLPPYLNMIDLTSPHPPPSPDADRIWSYNTARAVERGTRRQRQRQPQPQASLDNDSTRPEPASKEAMTIYMECKICFAQLSNQAVMPCGE
ncbi:MAG: hypothetical protein Q9223_006385 [Gallowayella weberi]